MRFLGPSKGRRIIKGIVEDEEILASRVDVDVGEGNGLDDAAGSKS